LTMSEKFAVLDPTDEIKDGDRDSCLMSAADGEGWVADSTVDSFGVSVHITVFSFSGRSSLGDWDGISPYVYLLD
jgi:hypothetical protein